VSTDTALSRDTLEAAARALRQPGDDKLRSIESRVDEAIYALRDALRALEDARDEIQAKDSRIGELENRFALIEIETAISERGWL